MQESQDKKMLFDAFKEILKKRSVSYKVLSKKTGMAESTVKRIFSIEECSLSRLIQLSGAIDLTLHDLVTYAENRNINFSTFSLEAEAYLSKNLSYFFFYRKIFQYKCLKTLLEKESLKKSQVIKFLKKLDQLNIIKWLPEDKIHFLHPSFLRFKEDGPLKESVYRYWFPQFCEKVLLNMQQDNHHLKIFSVKASKESRNEFLSNYNELVNSFLKKASLDIKTQPQNVQPVGVSLAVGPYRVGLDEKLSINGSKKEDRDSTILQKLINNK